MPRWGKFEEDGMRRRSEATAVKNAEQLLGAHLPIHLVPRVCGARRSCPKKRFINRYQSKCAEGRIYL